MTRPFEGIRIIDITHVLAGPFAAYQLAVLGAGDAIHVAADRAQDSNAPALDLYIMGGQPIGEPVAWYGPFVMNTREEIEQTLAELRQGTFV